MRLLVERTDQTSRCTSRRQLSGAWHTDATGVLPSKSLRHCARDENITIGVRMYAIGLYEIGTRVQRFANSEHLRIRELRRLSGVRVNGQQLRRLVRVAPNRADSQDSNCGQCGTDSSDGVTRTLLDLSV